MDAHVDARGPARSRGTGRRGVGRSLSAVVGAAVLLVAAGCGGDTSEAAEREQAGSTTTSSGQEADTTTTGSDDTEEGTGDDAPAAEAGGPSEPRVVPAGSAPTVMAGADVVHCIATAEQTGGTYSFLEIHIPAGSGPPPHDHPSADELFYMLSGTAAIDTGGVQAEVGPGDYFHVPRGATHSISAVTDVRLLAGYAPGGDEITLFACPT